MKMHLPPLLQLPAVALALLGGLAEFAALQRWRLRDWMARAAR